MDTEEIETMNSETTRFVRFLDNGVSPHHVAEGIETLLRESGSRCLSVGEEWKISEGDTVHVRFGGTIIAFRSGTEPPDQKGFVIGAAHTDSPGLQIKHRSVKIVDRLLQVPVEVYGSPILATWLDRELQLVGSILVRDKSGSSSAVAIRTQQPVAIVPNLAIHLNREANERLSYNRQTELQAILPIDSLVQRENDSTEDGGALFRSFVADLAGLGDEEIVDMELNLVPTHGAAVIGSGDGALIVSPRIDNLGGCYTVLDGFCNAETGPHGAVAVFYDHEEIGSTTDHGAAGGFTRRTLHRFVRGCYGDTIDFDRVLERSILVSNDCAHARHPNYADKHDAGYAPLLGGGPVVKKSAIRRYASELAGVGLFTDACNRRGIEVQYLQNRSDIPAGSTIGPAVASRLAVQSVDVGIPMLSMHSARETAAIRDISLMGTAFHEIFGGGRL